MLPFLAKPLFPFLRGRWEGHHRAVWLVVSSQFQRFKRGFFKDERIKMTFCLKRSFLSTQPSNAGPSLTEVALESKHGYSRESPGLHDQPKPLTMILKGSLPHPCPPTESLASCWPTLNRDNVGNTHFYLKITPGKAAHLIRTRCCMLPLLCWFACL